MPWRKYEGTAKKGKYGPIYQIARGLRVQRGANGKWTLFYNARGVRKNKTIGTGRENLVKAIAAAEAIVKRIENPVKAPTPENGGGKSNTRSFLSYALKWFEDNSTAGKWKDDTVTRYDEILRLHIKPYPIFKKPMDCIGRREIKEHLRTLYKRRSPATVESVHAVISGVFNEAIDDQIVSGNPSTGLLKRILPRKISRNQKDADPFQVFERDLFFDHARSLCSPSELMILKVMAFAGLRLGEALAMRSEYLDLEKGTYRVAESYKQKTFRRPKMDKARLIDLPESLVGELMDHLRYLRKQRLKGEGQGRMDLLFVDPKEPGGPWPYSQRKVQYAMKKICKAAELRTRNPHDLRHTYATVLLMAHTSPAYVQKQLGHHSISLTVDIYGHWIPGEGRTNLDEALGRSPEKSARGAVQNMHVIAYKKGATSVSS